jgi:hypothetical protein
MKRIILCLTATVSFFYLASTACAHTKSESHSTWRIIDRQVNVIFSIPDSEAKRIGPLDGPKLDQVIAMYLADHIGARAKNGPCVPVQSMRPVSSSPGFHRFEAAFRCPSANAIALRSSAFFDIVPSHVTFAEIVNNEGDLTEQLITNEHQIIATSNGNGLQNASFFQYILMGMNHIFTGIDHMAFILGFVVISRSLRDLLFVITGFTIGHSVTLALAVSGILRPHAEFIDALIGLTIALVGAENVAAASGQSRTVATSVAVVLGSMAVGQLLGLGGLPWLLVFGSGLFSANYLMMAGLVHHTAMLRIVVTLVFGLIHGFGFATGLLEQHIPAERLWQILLGFNMGVEIGQVTVVLGVLGLVLVLARVKLAPPRRLVVDLVSAGLIGFGLYLFVSRGYA